LVVQKTNMLQSKLKFIILLLFSSLTKKITTSNNTII